MVSVEVFDQNDDVKAKGNYDGVDLGGTVGIGLTVKVSFLPDKVHRKIEPVYRWPRNQSSSERHGFHACLERY